MSIIINLSGAFSPTAIPPHDCPLIKTLAHNTNNISKLVWLILYHASI